MKYVAKRPAVEAIQFTGLKSVQDIKFLSRAQAIRYEEGLGGAMLVITISGKGDHIEARRGDYVVRDCGKTTVMSEHEFEAKYEPVEAVNENAVPDPTTSHSINPFIMPVPGVTIGNAQEAA